MTKQSRQQTKVTTLKSINDQTYFQLISYIKSLGRILKLNITSSIVHTSYYNKLLENKTIGCVM